jgi:dTDP-4-amino-4,6-dideoxygalactose transaminase
LGAKPVFVDIDPITFNIDPELIEAKVTSATKAIIPVHLFGQPADMDAIMSVSEKHQLPVVEDSAQAIGASYQGKPVCSIGKIGCISFYPTKNLGAFGDAGMLTTCDDELAETLRRLRSHGMSPRYYHREVGINSRLDSIQAAVLNVKFRKLDDWATQRTLHAERYFELLKDEGLQHHFELPVASCDSVSVWNQFTIRVKNGKRNALRSYLTANHIGSEIYYPIPLHQQECFRNLGYRIGSLPETEKAAAEVISLPIFPEMTIDEQDLVVQRLVEFFKAPPISPSPVSEPVSHLQVS